MTTILLTARDGTRHELRASPGLTLMEVVRDAGITDMVALCGGTLSCATCHVYVDERDLHRLPQPSEEEVTMLEVSEGRHPNSRLACQVQCDAALQGIRIVMAP